MQSVQTLLERLKQQDISLYVEGDRLRCNAPKDKLTPSLQAHLSERKGEILDFLRHQISLDRIVPQPESRYQPFPLTDIQQAYWLGRQEGLELGGFSAHVYWEIETKGVEIEALERAWQRLIDRHDMLRAVIEGNGEQRILEKVPPYFIPVIDLQAETAQTQTTRLQEIRDRLSHQVFPSDRWPLFELLAIRLDSKTVRFCFSFDLIIGDAGSVQILMGELAQFVCQPTLTLPPLELSFRDCVLAEREGRTRHRYQQDRDYWHDRLATLPPAPELPLKTNPAALSRPHFLRRRQQFAPDVWQRLKRKASQAKLTPSGVLMAAFADILATWSKTPHFTLNLTFVNRPPLHPEIGKIVSDFTSITLLEANCKGEDSFLARSQRLQKQLWDDLVHQSYSGVQVLRELARRSSRRTTALMPIVFTSTLVLGQQDSNEWENRSNAMQSMGEMVYMISQTPQVYLDSQITEDAGSLVICWDAVESLFPESLLDDMFAAYGHFLQRLANEDEVWTAKTGDFLPPSQRERLAAINNTDTEGLERSALLQTLFFQQAIAHPERTAVIAGDCVFTYGELCDRVLTLAHQLREKGAKPNQLVAIVMEKGWEQIVAALAILTAGAAYVPIDPELPEQRRSHLFAEAEVRWILTQSKFAESLDWPENIESFWVDAIAADPSRSMLKPQQTATDLAYVIYTSGSTGKPKGVAIEHRAVVNTILDINQRFGVTAEDRVLAVSSLSFDLSVYDIFGTLAAGGTIVAIAPQASKDPSNWAQLVQEHRITLWNSVPALMQMLLDYTASRSDFDLSSLRLILLSGDWIPLTLPDRIQAATGGRIISLGGATEASIWSIFYPIETVNPAWKSIPYGRPLANQRFYVLDEALEPRPFWVPGQLYIGGIGLAREYWRNEEKTSSSFIIHPKTGERLYKTGDLGRYVPDGNIEFLGREDSQVKVNGYRIELGEIEAVLQQHPAIKESVVMAVGELQENKQLAAYIVPVREASVKEDPDSESPLFKLASPTRLTFENLQSVVEEVKSQVRQLSLEANLETFAACSPILDRLSIFSMCRTLNDLGLFIHPQEKHALADILSNCQIQPHYSKLLGQWLAVLEEEGLLQQDGEGNFVNLQLFPSRGQDELWQELTNYATRNPQTQILLEYIQRSLENQIAMLKGEVDPLELFFPDGSWQTAESMYQLNPVSEYYNTLACLVLQSLVKERSPQEKIRILEVGAGTGGTTAFLLPVLPPQETVYTYTDLSQFFLARAREKFQDYAFVEYELLDIDQNPLHQGYEPHSFDIVVAANVLHDARQMDRTLQYLRSLLAPNGLLLILEATQNNPFQMISTRFIEGYSHYEDARLQTNQPLLSVNEWQKILAANEFDRFVAMSESDGGDRPHLAHVMVARGPCRVKQFDPGELRCYLQQKLPGYMIPANYILMDALSLTPNGKVDRRSLPLPKSLLDNSPRREDYVAPQTRTERLLADIWAEVLKIDKVGINANFFEIGGDSLLNIQLVARAKQDNLELKPQYIFQCPTIAELASFLEKSSVENRGLNFSPPVPLKSSGFKHPLFCIHSSTGSGSSFIELARYFDPDRPLYALQSQGFNGESVPLSTIEEMATVYIQAMQTIQPKSPYYLCGWSMGGIVAFEMARQLRQNNFEVEFLGLIDIMADDRALQLDLLSQAHPNADLNLQDISLEQQETLANLSQINTRAMLSYQLQPYPGKLTLFKAREQPAKMPSLNKFGWDKYSLVELELQEIPGNHFSMMNPPNIQILSREISDRLSKFP